jgi:hypothetical protein
MVSKKSPAKKSPAKKTTTRSSTSWSLSRPLTDKEDREATKNLIMIMVGLGLGGAAVGLRINHFKNREKIILRDQGTSINDGRNGIVLKK